MNVALFGATGTLGTRILAELLSRGHKVRAVLRSQNVDAKPGLEVVTGDIFDAAGVTAAVKGADAVLSAYGPGPANPEQLLPATRSLIEGVRASGVRRILVVGGAGSLEVAPGVTLIASGHLPPDWLGIAQAHADALDLLKKSGLDWTSLSPAAFIQPGERTGKFRLGTDQLLTDANGQSKISCEDYAIALVDELEKNQHVGKRFTVAY
jgi:putative NADH-flavin reductase